MDWQRSLNFSAILLEMLFLIGIVLEQEEAMVAMMKVATEH